MLNEDEMRVVVSAKHKLNPELMTAAMTNCLLSKAVEGACDPVSSTEGEWLHWCGPEGCSHA